MRTLRIFKIGAVTLGLVAATLGTLNSRLATRQVAAVSAAPLPACTNYTFTQSTGASVVPGSTNINSCISQGCVTQVTLPFSYMLYGQSFTTVEVSSEGNIQFVGSSTASSNTCLPAAGFSSTIFAFWDIQFEQQIFTSVSGSMPNRIFNIEFKTVADQPLGPDIDYEIRLYEGQQKFDLIYGSGFNFLAFAQYTVGVQADTSCFTQAFCDSNASHLAIGTMLTFTLPPPAPSFDTCLKDNSTGNLLQWNSTTGAYKFTRCSDGFMLTGTGTVGLVNGIKTLTDFKSDRRISAGFNTGQLTGNAIIYLQVAQGVWQTLRIIDTNPAATCSCGA